MRRVDQFRRGDAGLTLVEVLVAVVILAFGAVAVVGSLGTLSSSSGINRVQASVASVIRSAAETIKLAAYIPCDNTGASGSSPAFISGGVYGYTSQDLNGVPAVDDPPFNPPLKPTVISVTDQNGNSLVGCPGPDPGLQLVAIRDTSKDGKVVSTLTVTKSDIQHTPNPPVTPAVTGSANANSPFLIGATATDSLTIAGTNNKAPTGTADFYVCGPDASATACSSTASNVVNVGSVNVSNVGTNSIATSPAFTPTAVGTWCFLASYLGDSNYNANSDATIARQCFSVTAPPSQFPLTVLAATGMNTLTLMGMHGTLSVAGPMVVDSATASAVMTGAAGDLTSSDSSYYTAGTASTTCTGTGCPASWTTISAPSDPLSTLAGPGTLPTGSCTLTGAMVTCTAGSYASDPMLMGGAVKGATIVQFEPGNYLFSNGFTMNGTFAAEGSGVFFYISGGKATLTPTSWNISPPTSGAYNGILLFQARSNTNTLVLGGNNVATSMPGTIYVPDAPVQFMMNMDMALTIGSLSAESVAVSDMTTVVIN